MARLTKEDIQAIAQELHNIEKREGNTGAQVRKNNIACEVKPTKNANANKTPKKSTISNNAANIVVILIWLVVFIVLAIKLAPYL